MRGEFEWNLFKSPSQKLIYFPVCLFSMRYNLTKNRYTDVLCYDHSRVVLAREEEDELSDYINANFVDGYKQKNAYISTQGETRCRCNTSIQGRGCVLLWLHRTLNTHPHTHGKLHSCSTSFSSRLCFPIWLQFRRTQIHGKINFFNESSIFLEICVHLKHILRNVLSYFVYLTRFFPECHV